MLLAVDRAWWEVMKPDFKGLKFCGVSSLQNVEKLPFHHAGNSGATALLLAKYLGAEKIYLLGYDLKITNGKKHWHGNHDKRLGNAETMSSWHRHFELIFKEFKNIEVVNCTRETALELFEKRELEKCL